MIVVSYTEAPPVSVSHVLAAYVVVNAVVIDCITDHIVDHIVAYIVSNAVVSVCYIDNLLFTRSTTA